jgi:uncharacterized protein YggE
MVRTWHKLIPSLVVAVLAAASPAVAEAQTPPSSQTGTATLHVVGNGTVFVTPDLATVTISVDRHGSAREPARQRTDRAVSNIISGLLHLGIPRPSIQTSNETLSTSTVRLRHHRHRIVYDVEVDLTVTTTAIKLLSQLFATASHDGATSFAGPNFGFTNPSAGMAQAEAAAVSDAHQRAQAAATALGLQIVGVQSIDLDPGLTGVPTTSASGSAPSAPKLPSAPVLPGRQEVDASVDIVFLLGNAATT